MKEFRGTPGDWKLRVMPDGEPFIEAPKVKPTAGYNIEVFGGEDGNYPKEMRNADFALGAAAKKLLFASINILPQLQRLALSFPEIALGVYDIEQAVEEALTEIPKPNEVKSSFDNLLDNLS